MNPVASRLFDADPHPYIWGNEASNRHGWTIDLRVECVVKTKQFDRIEIAGLAPRMSSGGLSRLSDRDLRDLGLSRGEIVKAPEHAPVDVSNDRV